MSLLRVGRVQNSVSFRVQGANNGEYHILTVPEGRSGCNISIEGTAASAVVNMGFKHQDGIVNYANSTTAAGAQTGIVAGPGTEIYAIVTAATATTDLGIDGHCW